MCEARALLWTIASLVQHHSAQARARTQREIKTAERRKRAGRKKDAERASSSEAFSVTHFKWLLHFNIHGEALHQVRISRGGAACKGSCPVQISINKDCCSKDTTFW